MSNWRDQEPVTDEDLVAYLDGKFEKEDAEWLEREVNMDRALEERLELMRRGDRPFAKAYDLLLKDAPNKRLKQILKLAKNPPPPLVKKPVVRPEPVMAPVEEVYKEPWGGWRMLAAAAVLLAVFGGGFVTSRFIQLPSELPSRFTSSGPKFLISGENRWCRWHICLTASRRCRSASSGAGNRRSM